MEDKLREVFGEGLLTRASPKDLEGLTNGDASKGVSGVEGSTMHKRKVVGRFVVDFGIEGSLRDKEGAP